MDLYQMFSKNIEFNVYLHNAGTRLLFKCRLGTHGLKKELGRHREQNGKEVCALCSTECEILVHVLWECPGCIYG